jgi:hypoxanthine-guanine phosphoribosyltransferase
MIQSRHILLVDDIFTTGATARAAAQSLIKAGAASVWVATLARARRIFELRLRSSFEDAENISEQNSNSAAATPQSASIYSSQDQPSF